MTSYLPITLNEARRRGWHELDVVFVTGDAYIDHPAFGVPLLARWLEAHGFRVGIIAQPDWRSKEPFMALGRPRLFFAVSAGAMDSMVVHYTPRKKLRHDDAYTPGNRHGARPNRATIIYTSRLKEAYRDVPVIIGGIEASLRRLAHYDYWEDKVRRSILLDAKADLLIYGMAEMSLLELAQRVSGGEAVSEIVDLRGTVFVSRTVPEGAVTLPSFESVSSDKAAFVDAFRMLEKEQNPWCAQTLAQSHGTRNIICNPPAFPLSSKEMDAIYALPFTREPNPSYKEPIPAFEQIKLSITVHRGCFGGCSFCAIAGHQGKFIQSRNLKSIIAEIGHLTKKPWFSGTISDLGGPTANMYGLACGAEDAGKKCRKPSCLFPEACKNLKTDDSQAVDMLRAVGKQQGVRHVMVSSGIRHDLLMAQRGYYDELVTKHIGGLLKVAPEHLAGSVAQKMRKPVPAIFERFMEQFRERCLRSGKRQSVVPYLMSGHPGCTVDDMAGMAVALKRLGLKVEQVQEFTPTPGTAATCMYYTGINPDDGSSVYVARTDREKILQKSILLWYMPDQQKKVRSMLMQEGRQDIVQKLLPCSAKKQGPLNK